MKWANGTRKGHLQRDRGRAGDLKGSPLQFDILWVNILLRIQRNLFVTDARNHGGKRATLDNYAAQQRGGGLREHGTQPFQVSAIELKLGSALLQVFGLRLHLYLFPEFARV